MDQIVDVEREYANGAVGRGVRQPGPVWAERKLPPHSKVGTAVATETELALPFDPRDSATENRAATWAREPRVFSWGSDQDRRATRNLSGQSRLCSE